MKTTSLSNGPIDYIDRPLRPKYYDPMPGSRDEEGTLESGLTFQTKFDGEDPRYARSISEGENNGDDI